MRKRARQDRHPDFLCPFDGSGNTFNSLFMLMDDVLEYYYGIIDQHTYAERKTARSTS